jgi:hypothetical protein
MPQCALAKTTKTTGLHPEDIIMIEVIQMAILEATSVDEPLAIILEAAV